MDRWRVDRDNAITRRRYHVQRTNRASAASWRKRLGPFRPRAIDVGLAVVVAVAVMIAIGVSGYSDPGTRPPDALAYALGATIGALLLARRRWPGGVGRGQGWTPRTAISRMPSSA